MAEGTTVNYPMTRQGVRDLDRPARPGSGRVNVGPAERAASALGGALLAGAGLGRGGVGGLVMAAVGASLAYRGYSGHCSAYSALGVNTNRG
ncbi:MAG: DUF2892 domain-containing protein [Gemmataceae bacterium]